MADLTERGTKWQWNLCESNKSKNRKVQQKIISENNETLWLKIIENLLAHIHWYDWKEKRPSIGLNRSREVLRERMVVVFGGKSMLKYWE